MVTDRNIAGCQMRSGTHSLPIFGYFISKHAISVISCNFLTHHKHLYVLELYRLGKKSLFCSGMNYNRTQKHPLKSAENRSASNAVNAF